ncbi:MAG TPA: hypothetical protein DCR95_01265 [Desulfobacter sp.]|uniref:hypothetical protein n=1 Tax=Desulfobacter sp. UBA2225 TaxID=1961413 RepID=UPI000E854CB2|nr:hypothetical protein [Desulfobacter sp. UBA2225]HAR32749.1 hypothetical protein [Desulfobacter sp.]
MPNDEGPTRTDSVPAGSPFQGRTYVTFDFILCDIGGGAVCLRPEILAAFSNSAGTADLPCRQSNDFPDAGVDGRQKDTDWIGRSHGFDGLVTLQAEVSTEIAW